MKQLNSIGARRNFFRNSRRAMRPLRPGMSPELEDSPESMVPNHNNGFGGYFSGKRMFLSFSTCLSYCGCYFLVFFCQLLCTILKNLKAKKFKS